MDLIKKIFRINLLKENIRHYTSEKKRLEDSIGNIKATSYDKDKVDGGIRLNQTEEVILRIVQLERDIDSCIEELTPLEEHIKNIESIIETDRDYKKIYTLKREGAKITAIAFDTGMSIRTVERRLEDLGLINKRRNK